MATFAFLWKLQLVAAFVHTLTGITTYHASLGRKPVIFLLLHSFAPLMPLVGIWVTCSFSQWKHWKSWEGTALLIGVLCGWGSYVMQAKAYSYQRYPFIALLILIMSIDFTRALKSRGYVRAAGWAGIVFGTFFLAPVSVVKASEYNWKNAEFSTMLQSDLQRLGGPGLSGHIQCLDSISGCVDVLYTMQLVEADGFMYDEFLFGQDGNAVVAESRQKLWRALQVNPPKLFVVTDNSFPTGPGEFQKLARWDEFSSYLQQKYYLCAQGTPPDLVRWWSRAQQPHYYRVYRTKG